MRICGGSETPCVACVAAVLGIVFLLGAAVVFWLFSGLFTPN